MDVRVLRYFLAVAQEENITHAAELLYTSQSNLSRQLAGLEKELGTTLFERGARSIALTEDGRFLRQRAKEIVDLVDRTEADLAATDDVVSGVVHIGAAETHAMRLLAEAMRRLRESHPQVRFAIFSGSTVEVTDQLDKGLLDFAVLVEPVDMQRYSYVRLPITDVFGLIMRRDDPLAERDVIRPPDVKGRPVLVSEQQLEANVVSSWLGEDASTLNVVSTFNLITTPAMMVEAGLGAAFSFDKLVHTGEDSPLCFRPLEPRMEAALSLVWPKQQVFSKAARAFLDEVRARVATCAGQARLTTPLT